MSLNRRVVVLTTYPSLDASRRLRVDPLVAEMRSDARFRVRVHTLLSAWAFRHKNDGPAWKVVIAAHLSWRLFCRLLVVADVGRDDIVVVHREAFPFFTPTVEVLLARRAGLLVMDVDDAIHEAPTHTKDWRRFLRRPKGALKAMGSCDLVFAGSPFMRQVAREAGAGEVVLAMTSPPGAVLQLPMQGREKIVVWTGSASTLPSLQWIYHDLVRACQTSGWKLLVIGPKDVRRLPVHEAVETHIWDVDVEIAALKRARLGVMPLPPDSGWEEGKSAYKALLYMAAGVKPLVSPVGMNAWLSSEVPGVRGVERDEWLRALSESMAAPDLEDDRLAVRSWARARFADDAVARKQTQVLTQMMEWKCGDVSEGDDLPSHDRGRSPK